MRNRNTIVPLGVLFAVVVFSQVAAAAVPCESLASLKLPNTTITSAQTVAAGAFRPPTATGTPGNSNPIYIGMPAICRVTATIKPTPQSDIRTEVWMPMTGWNGNFQGNGSGGMGGAIPYSDMGKTVNAGFATAGSDTGHQGSAAYALTEREKVIDYGYRAGNEMTMKAKAIIEAFYGNAPRYSFIDGCGGSAQMAEVEMRRFPGDYNGVAITGFSQKPLHAMEQMWIWDVTHKTPAHNLTQANLQTLHNAVMNTCDAVDGVKDGIIEHPPACKFDPAVLQCTAAGGASCLTAPQVEAVRQIYAGPTNPRTKQHLFYAPQLGSELTWGQFMGERPFALSADFFKYFIFKDPNWDPKTRPLNYDSDMALLTSAETRAIHDPTDPDISEFVRRGGKLLLYESWGDGTIPPGVAINYYNKVVEKIGANAARNSIRLFMVPALAHCAAPADFDGGFHGKMVNELEQWLRTNKAPDRIITSTVKDGKVVRTRPLCPYPQVVTYSGRGSTDDAANFTCKAP